MKLKIKALIFLVFIHAIMVVISIPLYYKNPFYFAGAEIGIAISVTISIILYKQLIKPLSLLSTGISTMEEKAFNLKLKKTGQKEWDTLIDLYNRMIDDLKLEQIRLQEKHYFLEKLINASPSGILLLNEDEEITIINPSAEKSIFQKGHYSTGLKLSECNGDFPAALSGMKPESSIIYERGSQLIKCIKASFMDKGYKHHFILLEELTEEIRQKERKAYEKVIRMMSHEVGNSSCAINSIIDSSKTFISGLDHQKSGDFLKALNIAIQRNNNLNSFMNRFADIVRLPDPVLVKYDINKLIGDTFLLFSSGNRNKIKWTMELDTIPLTTMIDIQQMEQVFINIFKNSVESIMDSGEIIIRSSNKPVKKLEIIDTGHGIDMEAKNKLFTPFFSTKRDGQGIGLTMIKEILLNHRFKFSLESDEYTVFTIYI